MWALAKAFGGWFLERPKLLLAAGATLLLGLLVWQGYQAIYERGANSLRPALETAQANAQRAEAWRDEVLDQLHYNASQAQARADDQAQADQALAGRKNAILDIAAMHSWGACVVPGAVVGLRNERYANWPGATDSGQRVGSTVPDAAASTQD